MRITINTTTKTVTTALAAGLTIKGAEAILRKPSIRILKIEAGMNDRNKSAFNEGPVKSLAGQLAGPAVISKPKLRNQNEITVVSAIGMSEPSKNGSAPYKKPRIIMPLRMNNTRDRAAEKLFARVPGLIPVIKSKAEIANKKPSAGNRDMLADVNWPNKGGER